MRHFVTPTWIIRLLFLTYNLYLSISLIVTVAIRALELEYLFKILDWGRSRSRYIFTDSDSDSDSTALLASCDVSLLPFLYTPISRRIKLRAYKVITSFLVAEAMHSWSRTCRASLHQTSRPPNAPTHLRLIPAVPSRGRTLRRQKTAAASPRLLRPITTILLRISLHSSDCWS
jgi:hypothetical protein